MTTRDLKLADIWLNAIKEGKKTIEGRPSIEKWKLINVGDIFKICHNNGLYSGTSVKILEVVEYDNFRHMLETEGIENMLPGIKSIEEGVNVYMQWYDVNNKCLGFKLEII